MRKTEKAASMNATRRAPSRKTLFFAAVFLVAASVFSAMVSAEGGEYNFGTMQPEKMIAVEPGKSVEATLYFFNINGNRDTHVSVYVSDAPQGFAVEITPPSHAATYNVSGITIDTQENVVAKVTPKETLPKEKPNEVPAGMEYVTMAGVEGFVPAQVVKVRVTAPADAPLWSSYKLRLSAVAGWFDVGSTGPVSVKQAREFNYEVRVITKQYSEQEVEKNAASQGGLLPFELNAWMLSTMALALIVVVLLAYFFVFKKKKK